MAYGFGLGCGHSCKVGAAVIAACALAMLAGGICPVTAFAEPAAGEQASQDGRITEPLAFGKPGGIGDSAANGPGYAYDAVSKTLTLSGIELVVASGDALMLPTGTTIVLAPGSRNSIVTQDGAAISADDVTIKGTGNLNLIAGGKDEDDGVLGKGSGVYAFDGGVTLEGGANVSITAREFGISTGYLEDLVIRDGASVSVQSAGEGLFSGGDLIIDNAGGVTVAAMNYALHSDSATKIIDSDGITVTSGAQGIYAEGAESDTLTVENTPLSISTSSCAVYSGDGLSFVNSKLDLNGGPSGYAIKAINVSLADCSGTLKGARGIQAQTGTIRLDGVQSLSIDAANAIDDSSLVMTGGSELTIPSDSIADIPANGSWSIGADSKLTNSGELTCDGALSIEGSFTNNGLLTMREGSKIDAGSGALLAKGDDARVVAEGDFEGSADTFAKLGKVSSALQQPLDFTDAEQSPNGAGYAWDAETKTLTLDGLVLDFDGTPEDTNAETAPALTLPAGSTIRLAEGSVSTISAGYNVGHNGYDVNGCTIRALGDLTIKGPGRLEIDGDSQALTADGALLVCGAQLDSRARGGIAASSIDIRHTRAKFYAVTTPCLVAAKRIDIASSDVVMSCVGFFDGSAEAVLRVRADGSETSPSDYVSVEGLPAGYRVAFLRDSEPALVFAGIVDDSTGKSAQSVTISAYKAGNCEEPDPEEPDQPGTEDPKPEPEPEPDPKPDPEPEPENPEPTPEPEQPNPNPEEGDGAGRDETASKEEQQAQADKKAEADTLPATGDATLLPAAVVSMVGASLLLIGVKRRRG